jgi:signal transduction histidine kinase
MTDSERNKFTKDEREQTDQSLIAEREKTDESLVDVRKTNERKTDATVKLNREVADAVRKQTRSDTDTDIQGLRDRRADGSKVSEKLEILTDDRLREQREQNDEVVNDERSRMDIAIREERAQTEAVLVQMLLKERTETDENLLSERKHTDAEVRRSSKLLTDEKASHLATKAALTTRDEFLAIVSHDLRNPIGAVLSYMDLLSEDKSLSGISKEARYWIEVVKRNAATSLRLISDILDMERFAEGKLQLNCVNYGLDSIIQETVESFINAAATKKIVLSASSADSNLSTLLDHDRILQVLSNLVGNAIKFTPAGGTITVSAKRNGSDEVEVSVTDSGPGIPDEQKIRIFARYAQLQNKSRQGLGLGLYISAMLIRAHRGRLWVDSSVGQGSRFRFTLPLTHATAIDQ